MSAPAFVAASSSSSLAGGGLSAVLGGAGVDELDENVVAVTEAKRRYDQAILRHEAADRLYNGANQLMQTASSNFGSSHREMKAAEASLAEIERRCHDAVAILGCRNGEEESNGDEEEGGEQDHHEDKRRRITTSPCVKAEETASESRCEVEPLSEEQNGIAARDEEDSADATANEERQQPPTADADDNEEEEEEARSAIAVSNCGVANANGTYLPAPRVVNGCHVYSKAGAWERTGRPVHYVIYGTSSGEGRDDAEWRLGAWPGELGDFNGRCSQTYSLYKTKKGNEWQAVYSGREPVPTIAVVSSSAAGGAVADEGAEGVDDRFDAGLAVVEEKKGGEMKKKKGTPKSGRPKWCKNDPRGKRPSPNEAAKDHGVGTRMVGNDGNIYEVREYIIKDMQQHRWVRVRPGSSNEADESSDDDEDGGVPFAEIIKDQLEAERSKASRQQEEKAEPVSDAFALEGAGCDEVDGAYVPSGRVSSQGAAIYVNTSNSNMEVHHSGEFWFVGESDGPGRWDNFYYAEGARGVPPNGASVWKVFPSSGRPDADEPAPCARAL